MADLNRTIFTFNVNRLNMPIERYEELDWIIQMLK
jgi:hypothetical protein